MAKYLIAYQTATGTTQEIAMQLAQELSSLGQEAEAKPMQEVESLAGYDTVIAGAPINGMQWLPTAQAFLQKWGDEIRNTRFALFTVSYVAHCGRKMWQKIIRKGIGKLSAQYNAVATAHFRGRVEKALPKVPRMIFGIKDGTPLDLMDQQEVKDWAAELVK